MSTDKAPVTATELVEEAKKRIVLLSVCVVGLSYLMSCKFSYPYIAPFFDLIVLNCFQFVLLYFNLLL